MNFMSGILYIHTHITLTMVTLYRINESFDIIIQFGAYILLSRVKLSPFVVSIDPFIARNDMLSMSAAYCIY